MATWSTWPVGSLGQLGHLPHLDTCSVLKWTKWDKRGTWSRFITIVPGLSQNNLTCLFGFPSATSQKSQNPLVSLLQPAKRPSTKRGAQSPSSHSELQFHLLEDTMPRHQCVTVLHRPPNQVSARSFRTCTPDTMSTQRNEWIS